MSKTFLKNYFKELSEFVQPNDEVIQKLELISNKIKEMKLNGNKILIFGNGGSAAIASHFSVDLTKNAGYRCLNFNESDLITCFSNDFGFENWVSKAVEFYGDAGDILIVISSSGQSENMHKGVHEAYKKKFSTVITLSGFLKNNPLSSLGDINLHVNSSAYNFVENVHQIWLLSIVDLLIGKKEYSA